MNYTQEEIGIAKRCEEFANQLNANTNNVHDAFIELIHAMCLHGDKVDSWQLNNRVFQSIEAYKKYCSTKNAELKLPHHISKVMGFLAQKGFP
ncbi:MAG: hypothetical protein FWD15_05870, partial [Alphaproteobacteria bacterium]|nr:hypothetical protein [Alphaproteobacteria bacterium]